MNPGEKLYVGDIVRTSIAVIDSLPSFKNVHGEDVDDVYVHALEGDYGVVVGVEDSAWPCVRWLGKDKRGHEGNGVCNMDAGYLTRVPAYGVTTWHGQRPVEEET